MTTMHGSLDSALELLPTQDDLTRLRARRFRDPSREGWAVRHRLRFQYFLPDDCYAALLDRCVTEETRWLDVGGGACMLPYNKPLARTLGDRCRLLVGVDPSANLDANSYVHERARCVLEEYETDHVFDLATLRMVAEHVQDPPRLVAALGRLLRPGGLAVIYTVDRWSPVTLVSRLVPNHLHHAVKRHIWGGEEKDTFPAFYRMNTHRALRSVFEAAGFRERLFTRLDDCATFGQIRWLNWLELAAWKGLQAAGLRYPESCLLAVYER
jgi:SAM-dependent methyltransferase